MKLIYEKLHEIIDLHGKWLRGRANEVAQEIRASEPTYSNI